MFPLHASIGASYVKVKSLFAKSNFRMSCLLYAEQRPYASFINLRSSRITFSIQFFSLFCRGKLKLDFRIDHKTLRREHMSSFEALNLIFFILNKHSQYLKCKIIHFISTHLWPFLAHFK